MPKTYRSMKKDAVSGRPVLGDASCCLGVRPHEVSPDAAGMIGPGAGKGMSVYSSPAALKPTMVSRDYEGTHGIIGAVGSVKHRVWTAGTGEFKDGRVAPSLQLAVDDLPHGVIEPDAVMHRDAFQTALANMSDQWTEVPPR